MDLNYLYHRYGVSLMRADNAACANSRDAHQAFAGAYRTRISKAVHQRDKVRAGCEDVCGEHAEPAFKAYV